MMFYNPVIAQSRFSFSLILRSHQRRRNILSLSKDRWAKGNAQCLRSPFEASLRSASQDEGEALWPVTIGTYGVRRRA
jgi:hypothetical protein